MVYSFFFKTHNVNQSIALRLAHAVYKFSKTCMLLKFFLHTFKGVFLLLFLIPIYAYRPIIFFGIVPSFFHTNTKKVSNVLAVLCNIDSFTAK